MAGTAARAPTAPDQPDLDQAGGCAIAARDPAGWTACALAFALVGLALCRRRRS
jgi:hypothetical protein